MASQNPYRLEGPTLISFSGGRTSAYMLRQIIDAHDGQLPDDAHVTFANTGKEREETLRFVHEVESRWDVKVHWLEWRQGKPDYEEVGFNSASRQGEPFAALIASKQLLPNARMRFCSQKLKVWTMRQWVRDTQGWKRWTNAVGLRADEGLRCLKAYARNDTGRDPWLVSLPMDKAGATKRDVMAFWAEQPFDLQLMPHEGNCDLCFLKGEGKLMELMRANPGMSQWWIDIENVRLSRPGKRGGIGAPFLKYGSPTYDNLQRAADSQVEMDLGDDDEHDAECGLICAA